MNTIVISPKRLLDRALGIEGRRSSGRATASSWMGLKLGDTVHDRADERHHGSVEAIIHSAEVKVRWHETGWVSYVPFADVRKVRP